MNHFQKKTNKVEKLRALLFQFGLVVSLTLTFLAFEWTTSYSIKKLPGVALVDDGIYEIPPITFRVPDKPAPKIEQTTRLSTTVFKVVPNNTIDPIDEPTDPTIEPVDFTPDFIPVETYIEPEEKFFIVEDMPEFIGGETELLKYLGNNTKYPEVERKMGNQGTVWVDFVVGKDGIVKEVKIKRGVSKYLDDEALKVIKNMPTWTPGKQRGRAVNVYLTLPIKFILKN